MKRFFTTLFLMVVVGLGFVQLLYKDKFNLLEVAKSLLFKKAGVHITRSVSGSVKLVGNEQPVENIHNDQIGRWFNDTSKQRRLQLQYRIGKKAATAFEFKKALAVEFDSEGNLYVLDRAYKTIEVFSAQGKYIRTLGIGERRRRFMSDPSDLALSASGRIYISDRKKGVLVFQKTGRLQRILGLPYRPQQLAIDSKEQIVVLTPSEDYLLHKLSSAGKELIAFDKQAEPSRGLRQVFGKGSLAIDAADNVYLSYLYPYRIVKYSPEGVRIVAFDRELEIPITPPTIKRDKEGKVKHVFRQKVSYDLEIGADGLLYNLVQTKGDRGGDLIDVFSLEGHYLSSFYLG
ncbi:MAG: hypothetical protein ACE5HO_20005, partial [bacterium]